MEPVIQPIDRKLIIDELTTDKFIRTTPARETIKYTKLPTKTLPIQ